MRTKTFLAAAGLAAAVLLLPSVGHAGSLGWEEAVTTLSEEGQGAGAAAIPLIIIGIGVIIAFALQALAGIAISALGGAVLIGNALNVSTALVPGAAAGGSIEDAMATVGATVGTHASVLAGPLAWQVAAAGLIVATGHVVARLRRARRVRFASLPVMG